jgi:hypothetical protein
LPYSVQEPTHQLRLLTRAGFFEQPFEVRPRSVQRNAKRVCRLFQRLVLKEVNPKPRLGRGEAKHLRKTASAVSGCNSGSDTKTAERSRFVICTFPMRIRPRTADQPRRSTPLTSTLRGSAILQRTRGRGWDLWPLATCSPSLPCSSHWCVRHGPSAAGVRVPRTSESARTSTAFSRRHEEVPDTQTTAAAQTNSPLRRPLHVAVPSA